MKNLEKAINEMAEIESKKILEEKKSDWWFQYDEKIPFQLKKGMKFFIKERKWHRVIKRDGVLIVKVTKI